MVTERKPDVTIDPVLGSAHPQSTDDRYGTGHLGVWLRFAFVRHCINVGFEIRRVPGKVRSASFHSRETSPPPARWHRTR